MEHILQFGINIDDDMIKRTVVTTASQQIVNSIRQDIMKQLTGNKKPTEWEYTNRLKNLVEECSETFIKEYKDEIIEKTSDKLSERLIKTKAIKDMVNKAVYESYEEYCRTNM